MRFLIDVATFRQFAPVALLFVPDVAVGVQ